MDLDVFYTVTAVLFGLLFGSFANVVIWRVPRGESIASPGSHCPGCDTPIAWYDNVPVVSWLILRGKCRSCGTSIAIRYPIVEIASGVLFGTAFLAYGPGLKAGIASAIFWFLLVLSAIDLDTMRLPNVLVGALAGVALAAAAAAQLSGEPFAPLTGLATAGVFSQPLVVGMAGALLGAGTSGGIAAAYGSMRGRSGLGMGDVKLLGAMGLFLGPYVLVALFAGSIIGVVVGVLAARGGSLSTTRIPFGPSLAAGGLLAALAGPAIVAWYLTLVGIA